MKDFELAKYQGKWAVFSKRSRTFSFIGKGKRFCKRKVMSLNNESIIYQNQKEQ